MNLGFFLTMLLRGFIEKLIQQAGGQLPATAYWQIGKVKGRIIADEILP